MSYVKQMFVSDPWKQWEDELNAYALDHKHLPRLRLVTVIAVPSRGVITYTAIWEF